MFTLFKEFLVHQQLRLVRTIPANPVHVFSPTALLRALLFNSTSGLGLCSHDAAVPFPPSPLPFSLSVLLEQWKTQHHLLGFWIPVDITVPLQQLSPQTQILLSHPSHLHAIEAPFNIY